MIGLLPTTPVLHQDTGERDKHAQVHYDDPLSMILIIQIQCIKYVEQISWLILFWFLRLPVPDMSPKPQQPTPCDQRKDLALRRTGEMPPAVCVCDGVSQPWGESCEGHWWFSTSGLLFFWCALWNLSLTQSRLTTYVGVLANCTHYICVLSERMGEWTYTVVLFLLRLKKVIKQQACRARERLNSDKNNSNSETQRLKQLHNL